MTSSTFSGLGGGANHSLRDVGKAEPRAEVDRPIASQGINVDMRSLFELPVTQNPHNTSQIISPPHRIVIRLRNRRLILCLHRPTIFRALTYWAHRAVILAIAWFPCIRQRSFSYEAAITYRCSCSYCSAFCRV